MKSYCIVSTLHGFIALTAEDGKLTQSTLPRPTREQAIASLKAGLAPSYVEDEAAFGDLPNRLKRYFEGERVDFSDIEIDLSAFGPFHAAVMQACREIPYGELATYKDLAISAGSAAACRAAGSAMARNSMPIIVPCHRVVASGGKIGGFSSGLEWKRELLRLEGADI